MANITRPKVGVSSGDLNQSFNTWTEQWENRVDNDSKDHFPGRKPVPEQIAPSSAYHSSSDEQGRCPHCYTNGNQRFMGTLQVDGEERPTYHCTNCNKAYAELPAAIKVIMNEVKQAGHYKVGFVPASSGSSAPIQPVQDNYEAQQSNYKLDQVNSNLSQLNSTIQSLMWKVGELADQNAKMMEQLANDPLISMRKKITEFDLK